MGGYTATGNVLLLTDILVGSPTYYNGSLTIPANEMTVGSCIHIHASGTIVVSTVSQAIEFEVFLNGSGLGYTQLTTGTTTQGWVYDAYIFCSVVGAANTAAAYVTAELELLAPSGVCSGGAQTAVQHITSNIATTSAQAITIKMDFQTSESANTCSCLHCVVTLE
jgi:hypothetical protein